MKLSAHRLSVRPVVGMVAAFALSLSCTAGPPGGPVGAPLPTVTKPVAVLVEPATVLPAPAMPRKGRTRLSDPSDVALPFALSPIPGGLSALVVSQFAGDRSAWVRRLDGKTGALGKPLHVVDQHVFGAFDWSDGRTTVATSDGTRLCFVDGSSGEKPACAEVATTAIVPVGDKLALLEVVTMRSTSGHGNGKARPASPSGDARDPKKSAGHAGHATSPAPAGKGKKKHAHEGRDTRKKKKPSHTTVVRRAPPLVEVRIRWADRNGVVDAEAKPTGLHFEAPLDGMALIDARTRAPGIDVLWVENAQGPAARSPLGTGRIMAASLNAEGSLDFASRVPVVDASVEYGRLANHRAPRLQGGGLASVFLDLDDKGQCEAIRVRPTLQKLKPSRSTCLIAPDTLEGPAATGDVARFDRILSDGPRRIEGQPRSEPTLVAWAGSRAYFQRDGELRSAGDDGSSRVEPAPFVAKRSPIAWGSIETDGEGIAFVGHEVVHVDAHGVVLRERPQPHLLASLRSPEIPVDRRRAVRVGTSWWQARGPRIRLWPLAAEAGPKPPAAPDPGSPPDTAVLAGGRDQGWVMERVGDAFVVSSMSPSGAVARLDVSAASPVRAGFDGCERLAGGAIVAGVSTADPTRVVAFTIDATGHAGTLQAVPLPVRVGDLGVRLTPLPAGGAILSDLARRRVVWLDDEARAVADAPWPDAESAAVCVDGRPARLDVPAPVPGKFTRLPDVAEGACTVGDAVWDREGTLRWFESEVKGLDTSAQIAAVALGPRADPIAEIALPVATMGANMKAVVASLPASPPAPPAEPHRACPSEMVSVAGQFCVDRFEAMIADAATLDPLSPDYPATPNLLDATLNEWSTGRERMGNVHARAFPLPWISPSRLGKKPDPVAVSRMLVRPSGFLTGVVAETACAAAGKRLCTLDEFVTACRGEDDTLFPYGDDYVDGVCNVFRDEHPAAMLHDNASVGHLDPRLNRVRPKGRPLLRLTGETPACRSRWGKDAIYDMVGNLDEWVDEGGGAFAGGFYSRSTRSGCEALVTAHPKTYLDYSTGVRCCKAAE